MPGDPELVAQAGRHYRQVAAAIEGAATKLRKLADHPDMQSAAVDSLRDSTQKVADDITRAYERYEATGQALTGYAPDHDHAQSESVQALWQAKQAQQDLQYAQQVMAGAQAQIDAAPPEAETTTAHGALRRADGAAEEANAALAAARRRLEGAVEERDTAAERAMGGIEEVVQDADLNDGWWENWGSKVVEVVVKIADVVALVSGILALIAMYIPGIGPILAAAFGAVAAVASVVSLLGNVALASTGEGEWSAVAWSALGVLSFGVGRAAVAGLKGTVRGARYASSAATRAARPFGGNGVARSVSRGERAVSRSHGLFPKPAAFGREVRSGLNPMRATPDVNPSDSVASVRTMARAHPNDPELARHLRNARMQEDAIRITEGYGTFSVARSGYEQGKQALSPSAEERLNLSRDAELAGPAGAGRRR